MSELTTDIFQPWANAFHEEPVKMFSRKPNALSYVQHFLLVLVVVMVIRCVLTEARHPIKNPLNGQHIRLIAVCSF